jgi:hypothetical protein
MPAAAHRLSVAATRGHSNTKHQQNGKLLSSVQILVFKVSLQRPKAKN